MKSEAELNFLEEQALLKLDEAYNELTSIYLMRTFNCDVEILEDGEHVRIDNDILDVDEFEIWLDKKYEELGIEIPDCIKRPLKKDFDA